MDNIIIVGIILFLGAVMGTLIPYMIKVYKDPKIKFDINYGYALVVGTAVTVLGILPDNVPELTIKIVATAFLTGYGLQSILNKMVPESTVPETPTE